MRVALYQGDCLATLRAFKPGSVDLVVTSPPYEAARTYGIGFNLRGDAWVQWAADRFMECLRVSRGLVAWVVHGQTRNYRYSNTPAKLSVEIERRGAVIRSPCFFERHGIPGSGGPDWFANKIETVLCATARQGKLPWSDNTACGHAPRWGPGGEMSNRLGSGARVNQWGRVGSKKGMGNKSPDGKVEPSERPSHVVMRLGTGQNLKGSIAAPVWRMAAVKGPTGEQLPDRTVPMPTIVNPGNIIKAVVGGGNMGDTFAHENEAPFPEAIPERFIRSCCPPGGIVLDPFCGSGTTCKVAVMHGRNAVGIDLRESQIELTTKRLRFWEAKRLGKRVEIVRPEVRP